MIDYSGWLLLIAVIVGWASVLCLILAFLAGAAGARRSQGLRVARVLSDEHGGPGGRHEAPRYEHGTTYDEWYRPVGSRRR
jgi:hypothetical protein